VVGLKGRPAGDGLPAEGTFIGSTPPQRSLTGDGKRPRSVVLPLTQEFLAAMLGVRRSEVSETASELQRSGLIRYRCGEITIIDHAKTIACECYAPTSSGSELGADR
jgi:hypothetical protein